VSQGLTESEKGVALNLHNKLRAKVATGQESRGSSGAQPSAANMREMVWDEELAAVAQRWADQCTFGHDQERSVDRFKVGQNVYEASRSQDQATEENVRNGIMGWYDEVKDFSARGVDRYT
jgi:hypothetical protein